MNEEKEHVTFDDLFSYLEGQNLEKKDAIEGHLAVCQKCHAVYIGLQSLSENTARAFLLKRFGNTFLFFP